MDGRILRVSRKPELRILAVKISVTTRHVINAIVVLLYYEQLSLNPYPIVACVSKQILSGRRRLQHFFIIAARSDQFAEHFFIFLQAPLYGFQLSFGEELGARRVIFNL